MYFVGFIFLSRVAAAQEFAVSADQHNVLYVGVGNQITIAAYQCPCKDINVEVDNGMVKASDTPCRYKVLPADPGKLNLSLRRKQNNLLIGTSEFRVRYQEIKCLFAGKSKGTLKLKIAKIQLGIVVGLTDYEVPCTILITQFSMSVLRDGRAVFERTLNSARFDDETKNFLDTLQPGDIIRFYGIMCKYPDQKVRAMEGTEITVID